jgi:hypothetical protein
LNEETLSATLQGGAASGFWHPSAECWRGLINLPLPGVALSLRYRRRENPMPEEGSARAELHLIIRTLLDHAETRARLREERRAEAVAYFTPQTVDEAVVMAIDRAWLWMDGIEGEEFVRCHMDDYYAMMIHWL